MRLRSIFKILGAFLFFFSFLLLIPLALAFYDEYTSHPQPPSSKAFIQTIFITLGASALLYFLGRDDKNTIFRKEGVAAVVFIWILTPLFAALPFFLSDTLKNPVQAYFEAMSGFTTTGATVMAPKKYDLVTNNEIPFESYYSGLQEVRYSYHGTIEPIRNKETGEIELEGIEAVSRALLLWRSFTQWLGGVGIVVLLVAILPTLGVGGKVLLQSEVTGPIKNAVAPRIKDTALQLWKIYLGLTLLQIGLLVATNEKVDLFNAVCVAFSTLSTGGFSVTNTSLGAYESNVTYWIVILFMIFGSINFTLYYYALKGKLYKLWDPELLTFLLLIVAISLFATYGLIGHSQYLLNGVIASPYTWFEALTNGTFQLVSAMTSTGFATADYNLWPVALQVLMLISMYLGGMSGSTAGGIKTIRHLILFKTSQNKVESLYEPDAVRAIKIGQQEITAGVAMNVLCFFFLVIALSVLSTFFYTLDGIDPETAIGLTGCMFNNTGLPFRQAGPVNSCAFLSNTSALFSCFWMLLGRLEFFAVLVLLVPSFWKEDL